MTPLQVATFRYESTSALLDGRVRIDGVDARVNEPASIVQLFERMLLRGEFDVAELGLTYYLRTLEHGAPYVALPVFPARAFRHGSVWVRTDGDVAGPADLNGRTLGEFGLYGQDAGVWIKGILADEHGFDATACTWVIGGLDGPAAPFAFAPAPHSPHLRLRAVPEGAGLAQLLEDGEIDALFCSNVPQIVLDGSSTIKPLFDDAEASERDYFRRTKIFPTMHTVVARRELIESTPELARAVFTAFRDSFRYGVDRYLRGRRLYQVTSMAPWTNQLVERDRDLLGEDWWPAGLAANYDAVDAALRYHHEQGITSTRWAPEEVFATQLLDT